MSQRRIPTPGEVPHLLREQLGEFQEASKNLAHEVKNDPQRFLDNPITRVSGLILAGIFGLVLISWGVKAITPPPPAGIEDDPTAAIHVACTEPNCRAHWVAKLPMDFTEWPLKCRKCGAKSVYRAKRCPETKRWYAVAPGQPDVSPFKKPDKPVETTDHQPKRKKGDDAEDGW